MIKNASNHALVKSHEVIIFQSYCIQCTLLQIVYICYINPLTIYMYTHYKSILLTKIWLFFIYLYYNFLYR